MKQHLKAVLSIAMLAGAFVSGSASATIVKLTEVTNNTTTTNGCTLATVYGSSTPSGYHVTYKVTCGANVVYVLQQTTFGGGGNNYCSVSTNGPTYSVSGSCNRYDVYKNQ